MHSSVEQAKKPISIPDLPAELLKDQTENHTHQTSQIPPPLSTTESLVTEFLNCDPAFVRSTMYVLPNSEYFTESSGIPFALLATPFSSSGTSPLISSSSICPECRSFHNCFANKTIDRLICNICGTQSPIPNSELDFLSVSSFELENKNNKRKALAPPSIIFVFDMSLSTVPELVKSAMKIVEDENFKKAYLYAGFIVINHGIVFYTSCKTNRKVIKKVILGQAAELSPSFLVETSQTGLIESILKQILNERPDTRENSLENLIDMLVSLSKYVSAAKVILMTKNRNTVYNYESFLNQVNNIMINIITEREPGQDKNNIMKLAFHTGGHVCKFKANEVSRMACELKRLALEPTSFSICAILKVSDNLTKMGVISPALEENLAMTSLNGFESQDSLTFQLGMTGSSTAIKYCQIIVHFTDQSGKRLIRIFNHSFSTGALNQCFASMSFDVIFAALIKAYAAEELDPINSLVKALAFYRKKCSDNLSTSQLVLPESIKCLPALIQAFEKKDSVDKPYVIHAGAERILRYFYPRLISLFDFANNSPPNLLYTPAVRLSLSNISDGDIYLMENGEEIFVYVPQEIDSLLADALFCEFEDEAACSEFVHGVFSIKSRKTNANVSEECQIMNELIDQITEHYGRPIPVRVISAGGSQDDALFMGYMVEDAINGKPDYLDYIFKLHFKIQKNKN